MAESHPLGAASSRGKRLARVLGYAWVEGILAFDFAQAPKPLDLDVPVIEELYLPALARDSDYHHHRIPDVLEAIPNLGPLELFEKLEQLA